GRGSAEARRCGGSTASSYRRWRACAARARKWSSACSRTPRPTLPRPNPRQHSSPERARPFALPSHRVGTFAAWFLENVKARGGPLDFVPDRDDRTIGSRSEKRLGGRHVPAHHYLSEIRRCAFRFRLFSLEAP